MSLFPEPNITDIPSSFTYANTVSSGAIGIGIPTSIFAIVFIVGIIKGNRIDATFTTASFVFTILSSLLAFGGYLNGIFAVGGIILTGLGAIWMKLSGN